MNFVPKLLRLDYHSDLVNPAQKLDFPVLGFVWLVLFALFSISFFKKKTFFSHLFLLYGTNFCLHVCLPSALGDQKRTSPLELELQMVLCACKCWDPNRLQKQYVFNH